MNKLESKFIVESVIWKKLGSTSSNYTLNKKLVKVGQVSIEDGSSLVNHLVD